MDIFCRRRLAGRLREVRELSSIANTQRPVQVELALMPRHGLLN